MIKGKKSALLHFLIETYPAVQQKLKDHKNDSYEHFQEPQGTSSCSSTNHTFFHLFFPQVLINSIFYDLGGYSLLMILLATVLLQTGLLSDESLNTIFHNLPSSIVSIFYVGKVKTNFKIPFPYLDFVLQPSYKTYRLCLRYQWKEAYEPILGLKGKIYYISIIFHLLLLVPLYGRFFLQTGKVKISYDPFLLSSDVSSAWKYYCLFLNSSL